jgi:hypothetical protein
MQAAVDKLARLAVRHRNMDREVGHALRLTVDEVAAAGSMALSRQRLIVPYQAHAQGLTSCTNI